MKVPQYVSQTQPSAQPLGYLSSAGATPAAFGAGIGQGLESLGIDITAAQEKAGRRTESIDRFKALTDFSRFQTATNEALVEAKRTADPSGKGYVKTAEGLYDSEAANYLASVPDQLKPEFTSRLAEVKKGIIGDSLTFQYQAGDAMFRQGIDDEYQKSLKGLDPKMGGDPAQLEAYRQHMGEIIGASDLSEVEKQDLARKVNMGLEGVGYKATYAQQLATGAAGGATEILRKEEGFRDTPYWDVNHYRVGFGSDTVTYADGSVHEVTKGMKISREDAERDLQRRVKTEFEPAARKAIGEQAWGTLSGNAKAAIVSVTYNYGSTPPSVVAAAKAGNVEGLATAVADLGSNKDRRQREAAMIRGGGEPAATAVDNDPAFANLPYEDRANLQKDATSEVAAAQAAAARAEKEAVAAKTNALYNGINDGVMGVTDVDAGRQEGWLTDFDAIKKAQDLIKQRDETVNLRGQGIAKLTDENAIWDPTDDKDRKMLNAIIGKDGLAKLSNGDQNYVTNGVVPMTQSAHDIPTDVVGTLTGMTRSNNQQKAFFALDTLNQLQEADPVAYKARVPDDLAAKAEAYRTHKDLYPADELMGIINGGADQQTRQANAVLEKEAKDILASSEGGTSTLQTLVQGVVGSYATGLTERFSSPALSGVPAFARGLSLDYQTAFTDGYKKFGNQSDADAYAKKILQRSWGVTSVGGQSTLMKYPPEITGYKPLNGSMEWVDSQVRSELGLPPDGRFELVSDDQTKQEFAKWQRGENFVTPNVQLPSKGLVAPGNINLNNRPSVRNADGSISTVRSISYQNDAGQEVLIPTVSNEGRVMSNEEAIKYWGQKGQNLGVFDTPENATAYAEALHESQAQQYTNQPVSYQVITYDANNVAHLSRDRHYFVPTEFDKQTQVNAFEQDRRLTRLMQAYGRLDEAKGIAYSTGQAVPQEFQDEVDQLQREYDSFAPPQRVDTSNDPESQAQAYVRAAPRVISEEPSPAASAATVPAAEDPAALRGRDSRDIPPREYERLTDADIEAFQRRMLGDVEPAEPAKGRDARDVAPQSQPVPLTDRDFEEFQQRMLSATAAQKATFRAGVEAADKKARADYAARVEQHKRIRKILAGRKN